MDSFPFRILLYILSSERSYSYVLVAALLLESIASK